MKSIALTACLSLLMLTGFAASTPAPTPDPTLEQQVERLNAYVRSIRTISGRFVQSTANGGQQTGTFYWKRPDKLRIEYDTSPLLIVSDGSNIAQIDRELETIDQIRISWTPYKFLLSRKFDLNKGAELVGLDQTDSASFVTVRDKDGDLDGDFTLIFAEPNLRFLGWTWQNAFDGEVRFLLSDVEEGAKLKSALFTIREEERRRGGRRR